MFDRHENDIAAYSIYKQNIQLYLTIYNSIYYSIIK